MNGSNNTVSIHIRLGDYVTKASTYGNICTDAYYQAAIKYGGTITAEHGTGKTRKRYMGLQFSDIEIEIMKGIKKVFDPNGILNPGTIID